MIYVYENDNGEQIEKEFSMLGEIPSKIEEDGTIYYRRWTSNIHIPYQWGEEPFKYGKSPSGRKKFF